MTIPGNLSSPLFATAAAGAAAAFQISRSLRFSSGDSGHLSRTPSSAGNRRTWSWSGWVKKAKNGANQVLFSSGSGGTNARSILQFTDTDVIEFGENPSGSSWSAIYTNAKYRDPGAWYHIVAVYDSTNATSADRLRLYVNGDRIDSFSSSSYPSENLEGNTNTTDVHRIGRYAAGNEQAYLDGYLAEVNFVDGSALAASDFGQYDDNNVWQPKQYSGTYGTNGFRLTFADNSSNAALGTDSSGNSNTFTVNNLTAEDSRTLDGIVLDGSDDYLSFADDSDFDLGQSSEAFTIEAWVKADNASQTGAIFTRGGGTSGWNSTDGHNYLLMTYLGSIYFQWWEGTTDRSINGGTLDQGKWTHVAAAYDGTDVKLYKNGTQIASYSNASFGLVTTRDITSIGRHPDDTGDWDGNISNVRVVKGTAVYTQAFTPSTDLTNVTNTIVLCCKSSSSATASVVTPSTITSNGNVAAGTFHDGTSANDSLIDTPTNYTASSGNNGGNYCTLNPLKNNQTLSNGNLDVVGGSSWQRSVGTIGMYSGKFYWEYTITASDEHLIGVGPPDMQLSGNLGAGDPPGSAYGTELGFVNGTGANGSWSNTGASGANDVIGIAFDADAGKMYVYKNGTALNSGAASHTGLVMPQIPVVSLNGSSRSGVINFGQRPFAYTPPTGYVSLCTTNLPDPTIADGSTAFDVDLWSGDNTDPRTRTLSFGPDLVWIKTRNQTNWHHITDSVRGAPNKLYANSTNAEDTAPIYGQIDSFNSDGFTLGGGTDSSNPLSDSNQTGTNYVAWAWDAGTSTASNTDGSITSNVRANQTAGFSIVSYTGSGTANDSIGHGLNAAPELIFFKNRDSTYGWRTYFTVLDGSLDRLFLQQTDAKADQATANVPTSSVFYVATNLDNNKSGDDIIAYCFTSVDQYSRIGVYTGNGNTSGDGPFVYLGFRPKFIMFKRTDSTSNWYIRDAERDAYNEGVLHLEPNTSDAEENAGAYGKLDYLSNGFKWRNTAASADINASGGTYLYMAFAEHPFKTARAR